MEAHFTTAQARALIPELLQRAEAIVRMRADLADAQVAVRRGEQPAGGVAEVKSLEAHLQEAIDWFPEHGIDLKGIAPLIVDFPGEVDGEAVLLCWLEGETALDWYHPAGTGFMGRRRLPDSR